MTVAFVVFMMLLTIVIVLRIVLIVPKRYKILHSELTKKGPAYICIKSFDVRFRIVTADNNGVKLVKLVLNRSVITNIWRWEDISLCAGEASNGYISMPGLEIQSVDGAKLASLLIFGSNLLGKPIAGSDLTNVIDKMNTYRPSGTNIKAELG